MENNVKTIFTDDLFFVIYLKRKKKKTVISVWKIEFNLIENFITEDLTIILSNKVGFELYK